MIVWIRVRVVILCLLAILHAAFAVIDPDRGFAVVRVAFAAFCLIVAVLTEEFGRAPR
jgi:hypothetical protein